MDTKQMIKGIHHVTATVNDAREDVDFYTNLLGQRLVKKTVNFDNNRVYHFYYGNEVGSPGSIMTTFPYKGHGVREGVIGTGQVAVTGFSVPRKAIPFWINRLTQAGLSVEKRISFGNPVLSFRDPSGLFLEIVGNEEDERNPWTTDEIGADVAIRGFFHVSLSIAEVGPTVAFLVDTLGFERVGEEGNITRFSIEAGEAGHYLDVQEDTGLEKGVNGMGTVHHVAWRIESDAHQLAMRRHLVEDLGFNVTEVKDRKYFHSIYFRIPGGVLFEIATILPGFTVDETVAELGKKLKLPDWEEKNRAEIEQALVNIQE